MKFSDTYEPNRRVIIDPKNQPPVTAGKLPLVYLVQSPCLVRVMNVETKIVVAAGESAAGQTVSVDATDGIRIGGKRVLPGPLDTAVKYGVYLDAK